MRKGKVFWVLLPLLCCSLFISCAGKIGKDFAAHIKDIAKPQREKDIDRIEKLPEYTNLTEEITYTAMKSKRYKEMLNIGKYIKSDSWEVDGKYKQVPWGPEDKPRVESYKKKMKKLDNKIKELEKKRDAFVEYKLKEFEEARKRKAVEEAEGGGNGGGGGY